ncbi:selenium metabolism membrane protein YedE/FdhT [Campylobacter helveticus]|uniref:selenium metabolism membrane protein YedE/FdhT n=1 Tax=Campylobacter helveticus TaxID=28898 RepID=UPI001111CCA2|nr:selenium metabolism membrane protein YedE/FdhT [Campylobacter helveticus]TNB56469.1 selenium metabolism membrane protein YedE/FdhT [Campylobacter helveticus]
MQTFKQKYLINFWDNYRALIALGILSAVYFGIFGGVWAVTGEMTRWGGEFLELFGVDLSSYSYYQKQNLNGTPLTRSDGLMLIGMFIGCFIAALWANKIKWRLPASRIRVFQALVGGALAGFGARLAFGCNLANFFTGLPYFSLHTWVFTLFMVGGIYVGVKLCNSQFFKPQAKLVKVDKQNCTLKPDKSRARFYFLLGSILFAFFILALFYFSVGEINVKNKPSLLSLALLFGFGFGFIIARAQICFTSCFRDLFLFGRDKAIKGALVGMIIASLIAFAFILQGHGTKLIEISPALALGAFLFGFGIVFAGGCECGWTYRAFEGQTHFMLVGIANIAGTMILALSYDFIPGVLKEGVKINLLNFGNFTGFLLNLILFILVFILILWYKRRFFKEVL